MEKGDLKVVKGERALPVPAASNDLKEEQKLFVRAWRDIRRERETPWHMTPGIELAIRLKCLGLDVRRVSRLTNIAPGRILREMIKPEGQAIIEQVRRELDQEFKFLHKKVLGVISNALDSSDANTALSAANLWLKVEKENKIKIELSAEDIIQQLFEQRKRQVEQLVEVRENFDEGVRLLED